MAKTPISNEELQLRKRARRRLVGAIVLVLLVVVLVPMFLEHEPRLQKQDMDIRIPPVPGQTQAPSFPGAAPAPATAPSAVPAEKAETPAPASEAVAQSLRTRHGHKSRLETTGGCGRAAAGARGNNRASCGQPAFFGPVEGDRGAACGG